MTSWKMAQKDRLVDNSTLSWLYAKIIVITVD